jgi:cysteine desulfurase
MQRIYFDNAATTKVDPKVLDAMLPFLTEEYGNASSIHSFGQEAQKAISAGRDIIAEYLGCQSHEIFFTGGATESNNLAIWGVFNKFVKKNKKYHFITSKIEHPSVLEVFKKIEQLGHEVSYLDVDKYGVVKIKDLPKLIKEKTLLISVMYVNNEVGAIQPIEEIGQIVRRQNEKQREDKLPLYFHVDAVQALNYLECDVRVLNCDLMSMSGHKIYGPKGVGALYVKKGVALEPLVYGGHQEHGVRSGTYNTPGIVGMCKAMEILAGEREKNFNKVKKMKEKILKELADIPEVRLNGHVDKQSPNIINVSFNNVEGESLLMLLDLEGVAVSTGSACSSGSLEPSYILTAMKVPVEWTHGSLRISLGKFNNEQEVNYFLKALKVVIAKLRSMAPDS